MSKGDGYSMTVGKQRQSSLIIFLPSRLEMIAGLPLKSALCFISRDNNLLFHAVIIFVIAHLMSNICML
jgi:hypothetical protein